VQGNPPDSPHLRVDAITVDGQPARFRFIQPTYPGDPRGPEDPDPRAHEASQHDPVGGPDHNPLPPACSPELIGGEGPSATEPYTYLDAHAVYQRPGAAYIALRAILGARRFDQVLHDIQRRYGGASIDEPQLEVAFTRRLPDPSPTCRARLRRFFGEWFDTAYPQDGAQRPRITGPGLAGADFYADGCRR